MKARALAGPSLLADDLPDALQLLGHLLVGGDDFIKRVCDFAGESRPRAREPYGKVSVAHGLARTGQDHFLKSAEAGPRTRTKFPLFLLIWLGLGCSGLALRLAVAASRLFLFIMVP